MNKLMKAGIFFYFIFSILIISNCNSGTNPSKSSSSSTSTSSATGVQSLATASNANTTVTVSAPSLSLQTSYYALNANAAITPIAPTNSGGSISSCSISPSLPSGITISSTDCSISGTPTGATGLLTTYTISATNSGGTSSISMQLDVEGVTTQWAYLNGAQTVNQLPSYGTQGVAASSVLPGGLAQNCIAKDSSNNLWLFAGTTNTNFYSDLWKYDGTNWTWVAGPGLTNRNSVPGTQGTPSLSNYPGSRAYPVCWTDASGNFWAYGGYGYNNSGGPNRLGDIWKFVPGQGWAYMGGTQTFTASSVHVSKGTPSGSAFPGARFKMAYASDSNGNVWIYGGIGNSDSGAYVNGQNDIWKFDGTNWTWLSGPADQSTCGVVKNSHSFDALNSPPCNQSGTLWRDISNGNLYVFGGSDGSNDQNTLFAFNGSQFNWINVGASNVGSYSGGNQYPSARSSASYTQDSNNQFWLYGGSGINSSGGSSLLSDVWLFDPSTQLFKFITGTHSSTLTNASYDTAGTFSALAYPGVSSLATMVSINPGSFFLFGPGNGQDPSSATGRLGDLFKFIY